MPTKASRNKLDPPKKPQDLSKQASKKWDQLIEMLPGDCLAPIDSFELKNLCNLLCQSDVLSAKIDADPDAESAHRLYLNVLKLVHQLSASFGLNPHDRSRLGFSNDPDAPDPFEEFMRATQPNGKHL